MNAGTALLASVRETLGRWLLVAACLALAATFLHPHLMVTQPRYRLLFVLDVSQSMNAMDREMRGEPVSRLTFARSMLRQALRELPCGSQAGLGLFTEYRTFLLLEPVEVCGNYGELASALDRLDYRMAWAGGSEISKGVFFGMRVARDLDPPPALVFATDGHEAPPLHPKLRPQYDGSAGDVRGMLVGVGGDSLVPIPKFGVDGKPLGYWAADEVLQIDVYSRGRTGSVVGESMVDQETHEAEGQTARGGEHLTSLRESHLRELASELGLGYHRLESAGGLVSALEEADVAQEVRGPVDVRAVLGGGAMVALVLIYLLPPRRPGLLREPVNRRI